MLTILVEYVPGVIPYQNGTTFLSLLTLPVPSTIWPEKPLPSTGIIANYLWPELWNKGGTTIPPGLLGECYLNLGLAGVFGGMLLFGVFYGWGRLLVVRSPGILSRVSYGLQIGLMFHYLRGEFVSPTAMYLIFMIPACVFCKIVDVRGTRKPTQPELVGVGGARASVEGPPKLQS